MIDGGRIGVVQNGDRAQLLLRAANAAHAAVQRVQAVSIAASTVLAVLGGVGTFQRSLAPAAALLGAVWAATYAAVVVPWTGRLLTTAALAQEMFDVTVLGLPWNPVAMGDPLPEEEVSRLGRRRGRSTDDLRDYYLVADLPPPREVYFCLEQNLALAGRVRTRYARLLLIVMVAWCVAGVATGVVFRIPVGTLIGLWFVPALGLLLLCLNLYQAQVAVTRERTRLLTLVRAILDAPATAGATPAATSPAPATAGPEPATTGPAAPAADLAVARQVQDLLFQLRRQQPRAPGWLHRRFHDRDQGDFRFRMHSLEQRYSRSAGSQPRGGVPSTAGAHRVDRDPDPR